MTDTTLFLLCGPARKRFPLEAGLCSFSWNRLGERLCSGLNRRDKEPTDVHTRDDSSREPDERPEKGK